jgi:cell division protein FtsZ
MTTQSNPGVETGARVVTVKIFGVGNAGVTIAEQLLAAAWPGVTIAAVNTDGSSLIASNAPEKISLESRLLRGLGTGGDPERGRAAAGEQIERLKEACAGAQVVFIVAGLGGGAGTGISPVLAQAARESGALVLAFVTLPFDCGGYRRKQLAQLGVEELSAVADGVICLPDL